MDTIALEKEINRVLETVSDPEIPVLSILDLGIVREAKIVDDTHADITITPTYSGCPAMDTIEADIKTAFKEIGIEANVLTVISPAWTTDWLTENGKQKLEAYGIAPPKGSSKDISSIGQNPKNIRCPQCKSEDTELVSPFGSTACKSLYKCKNCLEPFDYFKCL